MNCSTARCVEMNNFRVSSWNSAYETPTKDIVLAQLQLAGEQGTYCIPGGLVGELTQVKYDNRFVDAQGIQTAAIHGVWQLRGRRGYFVFRQPDQTGLWDGYWGEIRANGERDRILGSWDARLVSVAEKFDVKAAQIKVGEKGFELRPEMIQGTNNIMPVSFLEDGLKVSNAVGRIVFKENFVSAGVRGRKDDALGTCFLVAPNLILTANHVVPKESVVYAYFGDSICDLSSTPVAASEVWDYALIEVEFRKESKTIPNPVRIAEGIGKKGTITFSADEPVVIIHFPGGLDKKITLFESRICDADLCRDRLLYTTDTTPGSSGAPVINQFWNIIGLHRGPTEYATTAGRRVQANYGARIDIIVDDLRKKLQGTANGLQVLKQLGIP